MIAFGASWTFSLQDCNIDMFPSSCILVLLFSSSIASCANWQFSLQDRKINHFFYKKIKKIPPCISCLSSFFLCWFLHCLTILITESWIHRFFPSCIIDQLSSFFIASCSRWLFWSRLQGRKLKFMSYFCMIRLLSDLPLQMTLAPAHIFLTQEHRRAYFSDGILDFFL